MNPLIVVIGDVHAEIALAVRALEQLEVEAGRPIAQVFSVGDFGLFLEESDWGWLTGPKHHRHPEHSAGIREAWKAWRWPLSCIGGNHEPYHKLRVFEPGAFDHKLDYTNAGELAHVVPGLRVVGVSGIYHAEHLNFLSEQDGRSQSAPKPKSWADLLALAHAKRLSLKRLTYYKRQEIDLVADLPKRPHLLLTHDWPIWPETAPQLYEIRFERTLLDALAPAFHCCGHWHFPAAFDVDETRVRALNILSRHPHTIEPGWAMSFEWDGAQLHECGFFPRRKPQ